MTLTVTSGGTKLRKYGRCIVAENSAGKTQVSAEELSSVLLTAPCSLTSEVITLCMEHNITITMLDHTGQPAWRADRIHGGAGPTIRRRQLFLSESAEGVALAKRLLLKKNENRIAFLKKLAANRRNAAGTALIESCKRLDLYMAELNSVSGETLPPIRETLMGYEGIAGREYFQALSRILPKCAGFQGRARGSGADTFNQLLNYGYGILYRRLFDLCVQAGLDPYIGLLHAEAYNRPVLVYDLIEPFRYLVENTVYSLFAKGKGYVRNLIEPEEEQSGERRLSTEGKKALIAALEELLERESDGTCPKKEMRDLVFGLARDLKAEEEQAV